MQKQKGSERYEKLLSPNLELLTKFLVQMAKRMGFSVVGLPHYTVWHLYEPSVDDIRHMEEMEQERLNREKEEKERAERAKKIKEEFIDPNSQWEQDKSDIEGISKKDEEVQKLKEAESPSINQGSEQGPIALPIKDSAENSQVKQTPETKSNPEKKDVEGGKVAKNIKDTKAIHESNDSRDTKENKASGDTKIPRDS